MNEIELTQKSVEEAVNIITYCAAHVSDFNMVDQIHFCSAILKTADELKPLYLRNAAKDDTEKFIIKL